MSTNRIPRSRARQAQITPEALALFTELERMPRRDRDSDEFRAKSKYLAALLGLTSEWWTCNHVHDRSRTPCHPPWCVAHGDWHHCRTVRQMLLAAAGVEVAA